MPKPPTCLFCHRPVDSPFDRETWGDPNDYVHTTCAAQEMYDRYEERRDSGY